MAKRAVSVTLAEDNLLWLRGQVRATTGATLSAVLDQLISRARSHGPLDEASVRSVRGTVSIAKHDPELRTADANVRALFPTGARKAVGQRSRRPRA
jgi:hypothetical protein